MAFFGVFGSKKEERARFDVRSAYLSAPALHYSVDGRVAFCHDGARTLEELVGIARFFFATTASNTPVQLGSETLTFLYRRYGKRLRSHVPCPCSFALYDVKRGVLLLGGAQGEKCFLEEINGAYLFSSVPELLRSPVAVDFAILK